MRLFSELKKYITKKQSSVFTASLILAVTFMVSAVLGYLRNRFLYDRFFACCASQLDVFNAAFKIPDLIFKLLVTGALSASFIPVFSSALHKNEQSAYDIASTVINSLMLLFLVATLIALLFTYPLSKIIAPGFSPEQFSLMVNLTRILLVSQIFFLLSNFLTGIIQVHEIFLVPSLSPIIYNVCIILGIFFLAPIFGIYGVAYGTVIGAFFHMAIQIPVIRRLGFRYSPSIKMHLPGVQEIIRLMIPRSLSLGLGEIEDAVGLFWASTLAVGSISLLNLATQLMYLPSRIFATTVGQASLPILARNVAKNEMDSFRRTVHQTIQQSLFIALPITALMVAHRVPIIRIIYGAKHFPWTATLLTAKTLAFLTPAIICEAIIQILTRAFYALHDTKTPLYISIVSLLTNIFVSWFLISFSSLGIVGLAMSISLSELIQAIGLFLYFIRKVDGFEWQSTLFKVFKMFIASLIMGVFLWGSTRIMDLFVLDTTRTINLIILFSISSGIGIIVYFLASKFLKIEEYHSYTRLIKKLSFKSSTPVEV